MIPKKIHFVFGLAIDFGGMPFSLYHYLAVKSAKEINPGYEINVHYHYEPTDNPWWEKIKLLATMRRIDKVPTHFGDKEIYYMAHKADAFRMDVLYNEGGIYMDMDTICISSFDPLLDKECVMGLEVADGKLIGLCNAVMLTQPQSYFFMIWKAAYLEEYDPYEWNQMSVVKPLSIAAQYPTSIHIESSEAFFRTSWTTEDAYVTHNTIIHFERSYCLHLWESKNYDLLSNLTVDKILTVDTSYNLLARSFLTKQDCL